MRASRTSFLPSNFTLNLNPKNSTKDGPSGYPEDFDDLSACSIVGLIAARMFSGDPFRGSRE